MRQVKITPKLEPFVSCTHVLSNATAGTHPFSPPSENCVDNSIAEGLVIFFYLLQQANDHPDS